MYSLASLGALLEIRRHDQTTLRSALVEASDSVHALSAEYAHRSELAANVKTNQDSIAKLQGQIDDSKAEMRQIAGRMFAIVATRRSEVDKLHARMAFLQDAKDVALRSIAEMRAAHTDQMSLLESQVEVVKQELVAKEHEKSVVEAATLNAQQQHDAKVRDYLFRY